MSRAYHLAAGVAHGLWSWACLLSSIMVAPAVAPSDEDPFRPALRRRLTIALMHFTIAVDP